MAAGGRFGVRWSVDGFHPGSQSAASGVTGVVINLSFLW